MNREDGYVDMAMESCVLDCECNHAGCAQTLFPLVLPDISHEGIS